MIVAAVGDVDLLVLDEALDRLAARDAEAVSLVKLRYFAGLTNAEAATALGVSRRQPSVSGRTPARSSSRKCGPRGSDGRPELFSDSLAEPARRIRIGFWMCSEPIPSTPWTP